MEGWNEVKGRWRVVCNWDAVSSWMVRVGCMLRVVLVCCVLVYIVDVGIAVYYTYTVM